MRKMLFGIEDGAPIVGDKVICLRNDWEHPSEAGDIAVNGTIGYLTSIHYNRYHPYLHPQLIADFLPDTYSNEDIEMELQDTFKDIISGISIIFENYFIVGDVVSYNDFTGEVIEFNLKSTKIKNANGEVLSVANRNIMEIKNISQKDQTIILNLRMRYEDSVDKVEKVIINDIIPAIQALESVNEGTAEYMGISELAETCVRYQLKFKCEKETQWQAKRDANKIILKEMRRHNLSFAYPKMEVHNGK